MQKGRLLLPCVLAAEQGAVLGRSLFCQLGGKLFEPPMNIRAAHKSTHFHGKACLPFTHVPRCLRYCCELALDIPFNLLLWHVLVLFLVKEDGTGVLLLFLVQEVTLSVNLVTTVKT